MSIDGAGLLERAAATRETGLALPGPYLLFLGDTVEPGYAKTAFGLRDWAGERCVGEFALPGARVTTGLPHFTPGEAYARGARSLVIGVANAGGVIPEQWVAALIEALEAGLDVVAGMHSRLGDIPALRAVADRTSRRLIDVRTPPGDIKVAHQNGEFVPKAELFKAEEILEAALLEFCG